MVNWRLYHAVMVIKSAGLMDKLRNLSCGCKTPIEQTLQPVARIDIPDVFVNELGGTHTGAHKKVSKAVAAEAQYPRFA